MRPTQKLARFTCSGYCAINTENWRGQRFLVIVRPTQKTDEINAFLLLCDQHRKLARPMRSCYCATNTEHWRDQRAFIIVRPTQKTGGIKCSRYVRPTQKTGEITKCLRYALATDTKPGENSAIERHGSAHSGQNSLGHACIVIHAYLSSVAPW